MLIMLFACLFSLLMARYHSNVGLLLLTAVSLGDVLPLSDWLSCWFPPRDRFISFSSGAGFSRLYVVVCACVCVHSDEL